VLAWMWKRKSLHTIGREYKLVITIMENNMEVPQKIKNKITI
jgi:hypothetical protein